MLLGLPVLFDLLVGFSQWEASLEVRGWEEGEVRVFLPRFPPFCAVGGQCVHFSPEDCTSSQAALWPQLLTDSYDSSLPPGVRP